MQQHEPKFETVDGERRFRGVRVERRQVTLRGAEQESNERRFEIAVLKDAADLLDDPDIARRFIEEDRAPYGMELWPAAIMLAEDIQSDEAGRGRTAIEIGCGLGLVSIVATVCGWRVTATDCDESALAFAAYNARINGVVIEEIELLEWHDPIPKRRFDRVFAADVLYQLVDHEPILDCCRRLLVNDGVAILADPHRRIADSFEEMARQRGFSVETNLAQSYNSDNKPVPGRIFRLRCDQIV